MKRKIISISMTLVLCCVLAACSTENSTVSSESASTGFDETTSAISSESSKSSESTVTVSEDTAASAQSSKSSESTITSSEAAAPATYDEVIEQYGDVFGGLTLQQMQEDVDYLWKTMQDNYPLWGLLQRRGIDAEALYNETRQALTGISGDYEFYNQIGKFIRQFKGIGHLSLVSDNSYHGFHNRYKTYLEKNPNMKKIQILYEGLNEPVSIQGYANLEKLEEQLAALNGSEEQSENVDLESVFADNPTFNILEPDRIAYIKVPIMKDTPQAHSQFIDFYAKIAGFEHLIIDITGNSGGNSYYWVQYIAAPNLSQPTSTEQIIMIPDSQTVAEYVQSVDSGRKLLPVSQLPELPGLEQDDLEQLAYFYINKSTYEPTGESPFSGKIWVLIDGRVCSSSEAFALFCKSTGFATLVGTQSRGDSGGIDAQFFALPNSGLVVRFHTIYPTNADGSCNTEYGTMPDFVSPDGETPLETCLKLIESE
ncbi:MAG: hypothetical protein HFE44_01925 [Oscillospiraceae bacterium]|jgi:hypothetical protein|nr:hypothetical protein [Oscillospiraceae bacterium]